MKNLVFAGQYLILAACASNPAVTEYAATNPASIKVVRDFPADALLLRRVSAVACSPGPLDALPPATPLLDELKRKAAEIGANGVYKVEYSATGLLQKCMLLPGLAASGIAFRTTP